MFFSCYLLLGSCLILGIEILRNINVGYSFLTYLNELYINLFFMYQFLKSFTYSFLSLYWLGYSLSNSLFTLTGFTTSLVFDFNLERGLAPIHLYLFYLVFFLATVKIISLGAVGFFSFGSFIILSSLSLYTGALWASVNTVWGFFWVNDIIEYWLLVFSLILIIRIHKFWYLQRNWTLIFILVNFFLFLVLIRLNIFTTRHSFFLKFTTPNLYYLLLCNVSFRVFTLLFLIWSEVLVLYGVLYFIFFYFFLSSFSNIKLWSLHIVFCSLFLLWLYKIDNHLYISENLFNLTHFEYFFPQSLASNIFYLTLLQMTIKFIKLIHLYWINVWSLIYKTISYSLIITNYVFIWYLSFFLISM